MQTLVIFGLGLIGGSLAAAVKQRLSAQWRVVGLVRSAETAEKALSAGVIDQAIYSLADMASELSAGDVVFISVPTLAVPNALADCQRYLSPDVTVTDGASVKGSVLAAAKSVWQGKVPEQLVLGHPIAGSERSGVEAANPNLYVNHRVIITPTPETNAAHQSRIHALWSAVGAEVLTMSVEEHDDVLAATSHLPHAIAYSLVDTLATDSDNDNIFRYAAGGFRDFTRIASSDPTMWHDIMCANQASVLRAIDLFTENLTVLRQAVADKNSHQLHDIFSRAKQARDDFLTIQPQRQTPSSDSVPLTPTASVPQGQTAEAGVSHSSTKGPIEPMSSSDASANPQTDFLMQPGGSLQGSFRVPGDKSMSHRSIMLGSLAEGTTEVSGFLEGEDALCTLQAFRDMGVAIEGPNNGRVTIHGVGLHGLQAPEKPLDMGNSGTSMRLMSGILAGQNFDATLIGDASLTKRPMNRVANPLREMGVVVETAENGRPPMTIRGGSRPNAMVYTLPMASAQVKSCVLLAGLYAEGETQVTEPAPTRDHTERMLRGFGYAVNTQGSTVTLQGGGSLSACEIDVPADISSAAFFMVAASIAEGSDITLQHVGMNPTRIGVINILRLMGADLTLLNEREVGGEPVADIRVRYAPLKGIRIPEDQVPLAIDEFPCLFVAAACAEGTTVLTGAEELRVKESDRIQSMADGLATLGVNAQATPDGMIIEGGQIGGGEVETHHDHRIAMSFAVAALRATAPIRIKDCGHVATSFPNFVELAQKTGIRIEKQVH